MTDSPSVHVVTQVTRMTGLASGVNPDGFGEAGRVFIGPDDGAGVTVELDSLEAASRFLGHVQDVVDQLRQRRHGPAPQVLDQPLVLERGAGRILALVRPGS